MKQKEQKQIPQTIQNKSIANNTNHTEAASKSIGMMPPPFQFQRAAEGGDVEQINNNTDTPATECAVPQATLTEEQITSALTYNNAPVNQTDANTGRNMRGGFRVDWVRNLQTNLVDGCYSRGNLALSENGEMDQATILAIAEYQRRLNLDVDGKVGSGTRTSLETTFTNLQATLLGEHTEARTLISNVTNDEKYDYYKGVIQDTGGAFSEGAGEMNLLGIRGISYADGVLSQSNSAQNYNSSTTDDHFKGNSFDDVLVSVWVDAQNNKHVSLRMGSVDPRSSGNAQLGAAHLRDGQYMYGLDRHGAGGRGHQNAARTLANSNKEDKMTMSGNAYTALRATRPIEVWRDGGDANRNISERDMERSNQGILSRDRRYVNDQYIDINIHLGGENTPFSAGCQNVRNEEYLSFINEMANASNSDNFHYTLIDASKINRTLVSP